MGLRDSKPYQELGKPLELIIKEIGKTNLRFCTVMSLRLPRAVLPIPEINYEEPNRYFNFHLESLDYMMDEAAKRYWKHPNYLKIDNRPVVPVYGITCGNIPKILENAPTMIVNRLALWLKASGSQAYDNNSTDPFLIGIADVHQMVAVLEQLGFDAVTTMSGLPSFLYSQKIPDDLAQIFSHDQVHVENFRQILLNRIFDWHLLSQVIKGGEGVGPCHFLPSLTFGWNSGCRGDEKIKDGIGYPNSPIVDEPTPEDILDMFEAIRVYLHTVTTTLTFPYRWPHNQALTFGFAINEIGDGSTIYPQLKNGQLDWTMFKTVQEGIRRLKQPAEKFDNI